MILYQTIKIIIVRYWVSSENTMRITRAAEYAVRCVLYLADRGPGPVVSRKQIAEEMDIPPHFLGKIAQQLAREGIIEIVQGAKGGFRLIAAPEQVTLLQVVEAVIGEIFLNDCVMRADACHRSYGCSVHNIWDEARTQLRGFLKEATFAKLLQDSSCITTGEIGDRYIDPSQKAI